MLPTIVRSLLVVAGLVSVEVSIAPVVAAKVANETNSAARFAFSLSQYTSLDTDGREAWLRWLIEGRLLPACRATLDRSAYERVAADRRATLARVRSGEYLTTEQLLDTLAEVDRREQAAVELLTHEYRRVTHQAVGTDLVEFQWRMRTWEAIERQCTHSPYAFEGQPKLISWLQAAITQERLSAAPPLPAVPNFYAIGDRAWQRDAGNTVPEFRTALEPARRPLTPAELGVKIERYNTTLGELVTGLYDQRLLDVDELSQLTDQLAQMSLERISLATDSLALSESQRTSLAAIEPVDTAIKLARVKVSASRRRVLRQAGQNTTSSQWDQLKGLNEVSRRLATLAKGPDR